MNDRSLQSLGPWKRRASAYRYENPWIRVRHDEVVTPSGSEGVYGVVQFKNLAIGVIPLADDGTTWLVGQYRYPHGAYSWEIPEGGGPVGTDPQVSARRELAEEVGLEAARLDLVLEMDLSNSVTDERSLIYVARGLTPCPQSPDDTEELALRRVHFDELYRDVVEGHHRDSLTVAGVLKLKIMLDAGLV